MADERVLQKPLLASFAMPVRGVNKDAVPFMGQNEYTPRVEGLAPGEAETALEALPIVVHYNSTVDKVRKLVFYDQPAGLSHLVAFSDNGEVHYLKTQNDLLGFSASWYLEEARVNSAYSAATTPSGGSGGYNVTLFSGSLPTGLAINAAGVISGTPTAAGISNFVLQVADTATGNTAYGAFRILVYPAVLRISKIILVNATKLVPYSDNIGIQGGTAPYTCTISSGALPAGLAISNAGVISGTPTSGNVAGLWDFTARVVDSAVPAVTVERAYRMLLREDAFPHFGAAQYLGSYQENVAMSVNTTPCGGNPAAGYAIALVRGNLPPGLSVHAVTGVISGTPAVGSTGRYSFALSVTNNPGGGNVTVVVYFIIDIYA